MSLFSWSAPLEVKAAPATTPDLDASLLGGLARPPGSVIIDMTIDHQLGDNWCWAAASQAIHRRYEPDNSRSQCDIATATLGQYEPNPPGPCCEGEPRNGPCDQSYYLDRALTVLHHFDRYEVGAMGLAHLIGELQNDRPVGIRIRWGTGPDAHFVIAGGVVPGPEPTVLIHDPAEAQGDEPSEVPIGTLVNGYKSAGSWTHSFLTR